MSTILKDFSDDIIKEFEIMKKLKTHNVIGERIELYRDFVVNLTFNIFDTYLGDDYISSEEEIKEHFSWCFHKVVSEFEEEDISFRDNSELYKYFYMYFYNQFYRAEKIPPISYFTRFWDTIFDVKPDAKTKKKKAFEVLLELYDIFDKSLSIKNSCKQLTN
ncbi:MAG: hypothetical protein HC836_15720 [Richelia sp. RM2_1_2]|nr:hypothetical protein [Richelia sp. RM2_1_2]